MAVHDHAIFDCSQCPNYENYPTGCGKCEHRPHCTPYYHLPMWRANDVTSWMYGINKAMVEIDKLFHDFALRTGVDGVPQDTIDKVVELEKQLESVKTDLQKDLKSVSELSTVIANLLAQDNIVQDKLKILNRNYASLDNRLTSMESGKVAQDEQLNKTNETVESLAAKLEEQDNETGNKYNELTTKITDLTLRVMKLEGAEVLPNI